MTLSDRRSPLWPLPCDWCGRTVGCPCFRESDAGTAARVEHRMHVESVTPVVRRIRRAAA